MKKPDKKLFEIGHIASYNNIAGERWMSNLPPLLRQLPLVYLCIPGTIESQSYSTDLPESKKYQHSNIISQLFNGIRYFHISTHYSKTEWICCNMVKLENVLRQISLFALTHPQEVVFLHIDIHTRGLEYECLNKIIDRLLPILFTKTTNEFWIYRHSLTSICNTGKNVVLIYKRYTDNDRIFPPCTKYIKTESTQHLDSVLSQAPLSICSTFKIPSFAIKVMMYTRQKKCDWFGFSKNKLVMETHKNLVDYVTDPKTSVDNLNKIFILCVEYECYIDLLYLCLQIMDKRFFQ